MSVCLSIDLSIYSVNFDDWHAAHQTSETIGKNAARLSLETVKPSVSQSKLVAHKHTPD
jgi:uncharacterized protein with PhoU and TrkA domain